jgi:hypothetical protein
MAIKVMLDALSGLPNPVWTLDSEQETEFWSRLKTLQPVRAEEATERPHKLGYRGFTLQSTGPAPAGEITIYGGTVWQGNAGLKDAERALEKWLLKTAPDSINPRLVSQIEQELGKRAK